MPYRIIVSLFFSLLFLAFPAYAAWDGDESGKIKYVDVTVGTNYGFRVVLQNTPKMCSGGDTWAYLNESDSNYNSYVSALLSAQARGSTVRVYSNNNGTRCHIGYISVY